MPCFLALWLTLYQKSQFPGFTFIEFLFMMNWEALSHDSFIDIKCENQLQNQCTSVQCQKMESLRRGGGGGV